MTQTAPWTPTEDTRLSAARTLGLTWEALAEAYLPGRTPGAAKARFTLLMNKAERERAVARMQPPVREVPTRSPYLSVVRAPEPQASDHIAITSAIPRAEAVAASNMLRDRTAALFEREAKRRGTSPQAVRLVLNYSTDELRKMAAVAGARAA